MKLKQVSVFLENKPGQLLIPCRVLSENNINIITLSLADTQQFGILRLIVKEWQKAVEVLEKAGCVVKVTDVLAVEVEDKPGGLAAVVEVLEKASINIEYMYAFTFGRNNKAILVFRFEDIDSAIDALKQAGLIIVDHNFIYERNGEA